MAYTANTLANIAPTLLKEGLLALRENSIMASQCQFDVSKEAAKRGATINVEIPYAVPAQEVDVSSANTPTPLIPTVVPVTLDQWYEATFSMSDKDLTEVENGIFPMSASEAVKSLANKIDVNGLNLYKDVYGYHGSASATPDATADITGSRKVLNDQLAPLGSRTLLLDSAVETKMLELAAFTSFEQVGETTALREGSLGRKYGFDIHMDQNMPSHTRGAIGNGDMTVNGVNAVGATSVSIAKAVGASWSAVKGDLFTIAGFDQPYVITEDTTVTHNTNTSVPISPALKVATAGSEAITTIDSHSINLGFHRQAFCFVSRPLQVMNGLGSIIESIVDPISGCTLRLEISRNATTKTIVWSYDILWGFKTIRPEMAMRLIGS